MREESAGLLCCPGCKSGLHVEVTGRDGGEILRGRLECLRCGASFPVEDGLPRLVFPPELAASPPSAETFYDERPNYNYRPTAFRLGIWSMAFAGARARTMWVDKLEVAAGAHVLEVGVGNGNNLPYLADAVGEKGRLAGLDISSNCLRVAGQRMRGSRVRTDLVHGNAVYLPYKDDQFDGVLSIGGFNDFGDKKRSLAEMRRVAKPGAKVVLMDEGLSPEREKTLLGKYILKCMKVFSNEPPVGELPEAIDDVKVYWVFQETFWVVEFRKKG